MSLFDFFFPEQASASHLRKIAEQQRRSARLNIGRDHDVADLESRVEELEQDVGFVSLVLASILESADEKGVIHRDDIKKKLEAIDAADGFRDGRLNIGFLRGWMRKID